MALGLLVICWLSNDTKAQKANHQPKPYVSENDSIFWNKSMPVYLRLATTPDEKGILIKNDQQSQYTSPIYFDTEGVNYIRTRNAVNNQTMEVIPDQEVMLPIYADSKPPISSSHYLNAPMHTSKDIQYIGKGLTIDIKSKDAVAGVEDIYIAVNSEKFVRYTQSIKFEQMGPTTIKYYAVDHVGNDENTQEEQFVLDFEAPISQHQFGGPNLDDAYTFGAFFNLQSADSLSGVSSIFYKIDDQGYKKYTGGDVSIDQLDDGYHTLIYYAIDQVKNKEKPKSQEFYFDKSAPLAAADILGDRFIVDDQLYFSGRTKVKLTAVDNKVGIREIKYSINDGLYKDYDQPFYLPNTPGQHFIRYYATDNFGNKTTDQNTSNRFHQFEHVAAKVYVDLTGPNLYYSFSGKLLETRDTVFVNSKTKIVFEANDTESGLQKITYSLEGSAEEFVYENPISFDKAGYHAVDFYGYDNVNNRNVNHLNMYVDNISPKIFYSFSSQPYDKTPDSLAVYNRGVSIYLAAQDDHVDIDKIYYTLNGETEKEYIDKISGFKINKKNKLSIRAIDRLGNEANTDTEFRIGK